jgi:DNA-binding CsgD family transcriptional regulator
MYWRPLRKADLSHCLETQPACLGDQIVGRNKALRVWRSFLDNPSFQATVIESERPIAGHKIVACGMGVFVAASFADQEISDPRPGLNSRIIAGVAAGEPILLSRAEIGEGNAGEGLDFVNMYGTWRDGIMNNDQLAEVHALLGTSFVEHFAGYRFNRVLKEAIGDSRIALARATGTYRLLAEFPESESALAVVTRESALTAPYSAAASIYRYQAPVLRLRPAEQELLAAALTGKTDAELSADLGLSIEATKKRWLSIFGRFDQFKREILNQTEADSDVRGPQKRHRIVAYIRAHPEELRPFSWDT